MCMTILECCIGGSCVVQGIIKTIVVVSRVRSRRGMVDQISQDRGYKWPTGELQQMRGGVLYQECALLYWDSNWTF